MMLVLQSVSSLYCTCPRSTQASWRRISGSGCRWSHHPGVCMDNIFEALLIRLVFLLKRRCIKHVSLLSPYPGGEDYLQQLQEMGGGARGACHQHHRAATRHGEDRGHFVYLNLDLSTQRTWRNLTESLLTLTKR